MLLAARAPSARRRVRRRSGAPARLIGRTILALLAAGFGCTAYAYLTLPDVRSLRTVNPSTTAFIELRRQEALDRGEKPRREQRWVPYARISTNLTGAVLVAEDSAFWQHDGVDYAQLKDAMETNLERMEFVRGASTITQQVAKNLYLSPSKNPVRKLRELMIARRLEAELPKRRILEIYLNIIEWGPGIYGAEAAAREYFRSSAAQLGPQESALLAAAIINPRYLDPAHPSTRLRRRQRMILARMNLVTPPATLEAPPTSVPGLPDPLTPVAPDVVPGETLPPSAVPAGRGGDVPRPE